MDPIVYTTFMVILLIICVLGLISNILNGIILFKRQFHASTNYFLLGLTFSDSLLLALSFVRTFHNLKPFLESQIQSPFTFIYIVDWVCTSGSKYFTVLISLERCLAVCFPVQAKIWVNRRRSLLVSFGVGVFTLVLALVASLYQTYAPDSGAGFDIFATVVLQFLPFTVIAVLNAFIYHGIRKFKLNRAKLTRNESKEFSVTKMLLCVVLVFGFCHSFEIIRRLMNFVNYFDFDQYHYYDYVINYLADFFYVLNSSVNFIIYYLLVKEFRMEFLRLCRRFKAMVTTGKDVECTTASGVNVTTTSGVGGPGQRPIRAKSAAKVDPTASATATGSTDDEELESASGDQNV